MSKKSFLAAFLVTTLLANSNLAVNAAAKKNTKDAELGINNETLTGGVIHEDGMYLPRGMRIPCTLRTPIDTRVNKVSDAITVQTTEDLLIGDHTLIPANSFIHGYITQLEAPKNMHRAAKIELSFDTVSIAGENSKERKYIKMHGIITNKDLIAKASKVNDGELYKSKSKKAGVVGGVAGAVTGWAATELVNPFGSWGMVALANQIFILGSGVAGAYVATSLITKDDLRLEPGSELEMMLDEPTLEVYPSKESLLSMNVNSDLTKLPATEVYDKMTTMESESLAGIKVKK